MAQHNAVLRHLARGGMQAHMNSSRALALGFVFAAVAGCGVPPPDRLELVPPTPIRNTEAGVTTKLVVQAYKGVVAYDESKAPLVVSWKSSNPAVAEVNADGAVTSVGSGTAQITASVPGANKAAITATVDVTNVIVSTVEATGDFPAKFKLNSPPVTLKVVVKDEKGQVIDKPRLKFSASDYCVEATPDGVVHPLAIGECDVIVESAGKRAKISLNVLDG